MDLEGEPVAARGFAIWRITDVLKFAVDHEDAVGMLDDLVCAAIREALTARSLADTQTNARRKTDSLLLREAKALTEELGIEIQLVRLTTFTSTKVFSQLGDEAATVVPDEDE